jgi:hypothetical protein
MSSTVLLRVLMLFAGIIAAASPSARVISVRDRVR